MNFAKPKEVETSGNDIKGMYWAFVLYPNEDPEHKKLFDNLTQYLLNSIRYILHDKDRYHVDGLLVDELGHKDGQLKKEHYHFLFKSEARISIDKVSAMLGLPTHSIVKINSVGAFTAYLLHRTLECVNDDYQYKYPECALLGCLPIQPNKWDESYLFSYWSTYIKNTTQNWGDVVYAIVNCGHYRWLNKYRHILKDIYNGSHYDNDLYREEKK